MSRVSVKNSIIRLDGARVGTILMDAEDDVTLEDLLTSAFREESKRFIVSALRKARVPLDGTFNYVWIRRIYVSKKYRRSGVGSRAMKVLFDRRSKPTLFFLNPGELTTEVSIRDLVKFYRSLGFSVVYNYTLGYAYAFRYQRRRIR
jgi:GNAT superfamily N-acetyltransferase